VTHVTEKAFAPQPPLPPNPQGDDLKETVARFIAEEKLLPPGARVTVAVSGGGDSVALLHILLALARAGVDYQLSVAHLNHQLRPGAAEADEAFARELAGRLHLPCHCEARDVRAAARQRRLNLESAARAVRYEFLEGAARKQGSLYVATGHTRDDQVETLLWRVGRGSDLHSLVGIPPSRPIREGSAITLIRPLLTVSREALRDYLAGRHIPWRTDETNLDLSRTRSRIRHHLLPRLREELGEAYLESLLRLARRLAQLNRQGEQLAAHLLVGNLREDKGALALPVAWLRGLPPDIAASVLYRVLRKAELAGAPPGRFLDTALTRRHIQAVLEAVKLGRPRFLAQLPAGLLAECRGEELRISWTSCRLGGTGTRSVSARGPVLHPAAADAVPPRPLSAGDETVAIPELGLQVVVRGLARSEVDWADWLRRKSPLEELVDADRLTPKSDHLPCPPPRGEGKGEGGPASEALLLRTREPGDRFRPLNGPGERKLKEFFIDRKVPRRERDRTLLLARGKEVLWVVGLGPSDDVKVRAESQRLLHLRVEALTGRGVLTE
jgi:tRNA(Ile)-lysidine synthase